MIKLLIANGCSYTRGAELDDPAMEAWPRVLGARLSAAVVNMASDGGSNRRIVRTTLGNVERLLAERSIRPEECLFIGMWTGLTRGECHRRHRHDRGNRPKLPYETNWHRLGRWRIDEGDAASEAYFGHLWDEAGAATNTFTDWLLLDAYLLRLGVHARYCYAWDMLPAKLPEEARALALRVDTDRVFGGCADRSTVSFHTLISGRYPTGKLFHPLREAHAAFAEDLFAWLSTDHHLLSGDERRDCEESVRQGRWK